MNASWRVPQPWAGRLLGAGIAASALLVGWLGYGAIEGWRRSATLLAARNAAETVERLTTVLGRDMRGVQASVLASAQWDQFMLDPPYDVRTTAASAFARFPYPESFFAWRGSAEAGAVVFLNRADRRPPWVRGDAWPSRFPVVVEYAPTIAGELLARIRRDSALGRRYSAFEATLSGVRYHVVTRLLYRDALREKLEGGFGFTVNLGWVREHYFPEIARQVARIGDAETTLPLTVLDAAGAHVAGSDPAALEPPIARRRFALAFFDPLAVGLDQPDQPQEFWEAAAGAGRDRTLNDAIVGGNRTMGVAAIAAGVFVVGLVLTARASRARARLAELRSDFVSTVTHELKTPIAAIRAAGDTLARGRVSGPDALRDYFQLVVQESKRLTRLVDNLLAYARITDVTEVYSFTALDPRALIDEVVAGFKSTLHDRGFDVELDVSEDAPAIRGDRTACVLLFDNLVDNAIRYSRDEKRIRIQARVAGRGVAIAVTDHGAGIPPEELGQVTRRFFRGRNAGSGGSGLGLAIASRITADHGGTLSIDSAVGRGTTVTVTLPAAG